MTDSCRTRRDFLKGAALAPVGLAALSAEGSVLAQARELHLTAGGAGSRSGVSWQHAFAAAQLQTVVNETMEPGDRLLVGGGTYRGVALVVSRGGEPGYDKQIVGVDLGEGLPRLCGDWSVERPAVGHTAIRIEAGVSHVTLRGVRIQGYRIGVHAPAVPGGAARTHLRLDDVRIEQARYGLHLANCDDVQLRDCVVRRYTKHGFRFEQGCDRVTLRRCIADCSEGDPSWEARTELLPFGFFLNTSSIPHSAFLFEHCVARNNMMPLQQASFKNGDGFVVERSASGVRFVGCRSLRSQDGGFDLKARDVRLTDCVAVGNSRGFRLWSAGVLRNCFAGWGNVGLWVNGGPVRAYRCTFHEMADAAVVTDDAAEQGTTLVDCLVTAAAAQRNTGRGTVTFQGTVVLADSDDARYPRPARDWDGLGNHMDSARHPHKGYRSTLRSNSQSG
ncbi:MAG TPA: right-handed parallel beta-helix repeat-containing protein [Chthonomonadales bacterium]|nr:right-handed parallel beta-helix repeat-containing protein [Chthonomonadales bacterium]